VAGLSGVGSIAAQGLSTCAVKAGAAYCWGLNHHGQLGDGTITNRRTLVPVVGLSSGVAQLGGGLYHACARLATGTVTCWGHASFGQLGNGSRTQRSIPVTVSGLANVAGIASGDNHNLAQLATGGIRSWGDGASGQLGNGTTSSKSTPVSVIGHQ
jgi:alpha-tubulin suppressor-like RCC1 family protein